MIKVLLAALTLLAFSAVPASAEPISSAIALLASTFAASSIGTFLTTTMVGRLLTSVAISALKMALAPKAKSGQSAGIQTNITQTGADQPVSWVMGKYATAGVFACPPMTHGKVKKTPNAYLTYVVNLSDIPGMTLSRVAVNGVWITFSGAAHADYGTPATGDYAGYAWVKYYDGSQTVADPMLLSKYGSYPDRPWTSDMIGRDMCYAIMTFRVKQELFSGFPTVLFEVSGIPLYDPRKDSTVGGSGAHRWATRSTWEPSNNPFVQIYNIMRGVQITSTEYWGGRADASDVPLATWMTAMNASDASVSLAAGGSEPKYRSGVEVFASDEPASVIEELLKSCAGDVCDIGGVWKARAGGVSLPVYMFTDDDLIITQSATFDPFPAGLSGVFNAAVATYPEPVSTYETETSPQMLFPDYETEDRGQRLPAALSLPAVPYTNQVQRLCDAYVRDNRRFRRHSTPMPPAAMLLEPLDAVAWTSTLNGYVGKVFEVEEIRDDIMTGLQGVSTRERDPADYSWSSSRELPTEPRPFTLVLPVVQAVPDWDVTGVSVLDASSNARRPALSFAWDGDEQDDVTGIEWEIRLNGTATVIHRGSTTLIDASVFIYTSGILPNTVYQARARFVSRNARSWSAWDTATTPNTGLTNADFGSAGAYQSLFTPDGLYMVRDVATLPGSGAFVGEKVHVTTTGKYYSWNGSVWQMFIADPADASITTASFAAGIAPVEILGALPTTGNFAGRTVFLTTNSKLYRHTGSPSGSAGFTTATSGVDLTPGTLGTAAFASTITPVEIVASLPTSGNFAGRTVFLTTVGKIYRHLGTPSGSAGFTVATDGTDIIANSITAGQIAAGAIGATEIAADAILTKHLAISDTSNLYPDPDFTDPSQYTAVSDFQINANTWGSSRNYLHIGGVTGFTSDKATLGPAFAVNEGLEYQIACKVGVSGSGGASTSLVSIRWYSDIAMTTAISTVAVASNATIGGRTTRVQDIFTAPAGAVRARMRFQRGASATGGVNAVFNEIVIRRAAAGELIVDGSVTAVALAADSVVAGKIAAAAVNAREIAAGAIVASKVVVSDFANIFPDYDMADDDFYFTASGAVFSFVGTSAASLGANYLAIAPDASARSVFSNWFNVEPDTEYRVSGAAWLTSSAAGQGTSTVSIETGEVDAAGAVTLLGGTTVKARTDLGYSSGSFGVINITTGPTARRARFKLLRAAGGAGSARGGGFKLQKRHNAELLVDGIFAVTGMAAFGGVLQSATYAESGGIPTAGWQLTQAGTFKGKDIILRDAMTDNSVSDKLYVAAAGPHNATSGSGTAVIATLGIGATLAGEIRKYGFAYEGNNNGSADISFVGQIRIKYLGVWGAWITKFTTTPAAGQPYEADGNSFNLAGVYGDVEIRLVITRGGTFNSATGVLKNVSITCINLVK